LKKEAAASVAQPQSPAIGIKKKKSKKFLLIGIVIVGVIIIALSFSGSSGDDQYVQMVKNGHLNNYPNKTVGEAFGGYLSNAKWSSGTSTEGNKFVNVRGRGTFMGNRVDTLVQFSVDYDNGTFEYRALEVNGVPQANLIAIGLFENIFK